MMAWFLGVITVLCLFLPHPVSAGSLSIGFGFQRNVSPLQIKGGQQNILYGSDMVTITNAVLSDASVNDSTEPKKGQQPVSGAPKQGGAPVFPAASAGVDIFFSNSMRVVSVPVSYRVSDRVKVHASVPYITRKFQYQGKTYKKKGLGDASLGASYVWGSPETFAAITDLTLIFPTGDKDAFDQDMRVPLGSGSYSVALNQGFSKRIEGRKLRLFGNAGLRYFTKSDYKMLNSNVSEDRGYLFAGLIGLEYYLTDRLSLEVKENYIYNSEGKKNVDGSGWQAGNDYLKTSDFIMALKYRFRGDWIAAFTALVPTYTKTDVDVPGSERRRPALSFNFNKLF